MRIELLAAIPNFRRLGADRRGATAVVFALGATALLGLVGLATEGGTWYLEKHHGQNAADAAAIAGVLALASGQDATTSANKAAALTGDTNGLTVTTGIFNGPTFVANATPATAVKAVVSTSSAPLFAGLFLNSNVDDQRKRRGRAGRNRPGVHAGWGRWVVVRRQHQYFCEWLHARLQCHRVSVDQRGHAVARGRQRVAGQRRRMQRLHGSHNASADVSAA